MRSKPIWARYLSDKPPSDPAQFRRVTITVRVRSSRDGDDVPALKALANAAGQAAKAAVYRHEMRSFKRAMQAWRSLYGANDPTDPDPGEAWKTGASR